MTDKNKTVVRKKIGRKIQPARFESLEISCEWEDEIFWTNPKERQEKLDKITQAGIVDFQRSFDAVCKSLNLEDHPVSVTHETPDGTVKKGSMSMPAADTGKKDVSKKDVSKKDVVVSDEEFFDGI